MVFLGLSSDVWSAIAAIAASVQTIAIICALVYAVRQTMQINKQLQLSQISMARDQLQRVNEFLLNPEIRTEAEAIGETKRGVFAATILNTFAALYDLKEADQTSEDEWQSNLNAIQDVMKRELMWKYWLGDPNPHAAEADQVAHRKYYAQGFRKCIDSTLPLDEIPPQILARFPEIINNSTKVKKGVAPSSFGLLL